MNKALPVILGLGAIGGIAWWLFFREGAKSAPAAPPLAPSAQACATFDSCMARQGGGVAAQPSWGSAAAALLCRQHLTPACQTYQLSRVGESWAKLLQEMGKGGGV